jgi:hypothetical protein
MLRDGGEDMNRQVVCVWKVHGSELDAALHQGSGEQNVSSKSVQLRDEQRSAMQTAERESFSQRGPVLSLAALNLHKLSNQFPSPAVEVVGHGLFLSFLAKTGLSLASLC